MANKKKVTHKSQADRRIYLIVVQEEKVIEPVITYAARLAKLNNGSVGLAYVVGTPDFMHWVGLEEKITHELRERAELTMWNYAGHVREKSDAPCAFFLGEQGSKPKAILEILKENKENIKALILSVDKPEDGGPGPLVSFFSSKASEHLDIPLILVPQNMDISDFDVTS